MFYLCLRVGEVSLLAQKRCKDTLFFDTLYLQSRKKAIFNKQAYFSFAEFCRDSTSNASICVFAVPKFVFALDFP